MFLIKIDSQNQWWCNQYSETKDYYIFESKTKKGTKQKHWIRKDKVMEILETEIPEKEDERKSEE